MIFQDFLKEIISETLLRNIQKVFNNYLHKSIQGCFQKLFKSLLLKLKKNSSKIYTIFFQTSIFNFAQKILYFTQRRLALIKKNLPGFFPMFLPAIPLCILPWLGFYQQLLQNFFHRYLKISPEIPIGALTVFFQRFLYLGFILKPVLFKSLSKESLQKKIQRFL